MSDIVRIPPIKLIPEPLNEEAKQAMGYKWADPEIGTRHRIGGQPNFIQSGETPNCPACKQEMTFYAQLDSIGDEYDIADCGMIYVYLCYDCFEATAFVHAG
jgi:hypothetical protein